MRTKLSRMTKQAGLWWSLLQWLMTGKQLKGSPWLYAGPFVGTRQLLWHSEAGTSRVRLRLPETSQLLRGVGQQFDYFFDLCLKVNERPDFVCLFINRGRSLRTNVHKIWWLQLQCYSPLCYVHTPKLQLGCNRLFSIPHMTCTYTHCNLALKGWSLWWNTKLSLLGIS